MRQMAKKLERKKGDMVFVIYDMDKGRNIRGCFMEYLI